MAIILALLPIVTALFLLIKLRLSPGKALPIAFGMTALFGVTYWKMPLIATAVHTLLGCLNSISILLTIYGAVLLLNVLDRSGAINSINDTFTHITNDRRIQILIIAWFFSNFIEGAAGFGAAPALAAPILVGLGFPVIPAVASSLICNTLPVPFGAVGTPTLTLEKLLSSTLIEQQIDEADFFTSFLSQFTSISICAGVFLPLIATAFVILLSSKQRRLRSILEIAPLSLAAGLLYVIPWKLSAMLFGPELPSILATIIGLPLFFLLLRLKWLTPKYCWSFQESTAPQQQTTTAATVTIPKWKAWLPYLLIALFLIIARIHCIKYWLVSISTVTLPNLFHYDSTRFSISLMMNPGLLPFFFVAMGATHLFGMKEREFWQINLASLKQMQSASYAIAASFAMVQLMFISDKYNAPGMLNVLAQACAKLMGHHYLLIAPALGSFGTFFAGSCTLSNILFGHFQFNAALQTALPPELILALQNAGGGLGSMIRLSGIVATCATVKAVGQEGKLLLLCLLPLLLMLLLILLATIIV